MCFMTDLKNDLVILAISYEPSYLGEVATDMFCIVPYRLHLIRTINIQYSTETKVS